MATPIKAQGTLVKKGVTAIVDVANFDFSGIERAMGETTNLDDTWETFLPTTLNAGELSMDVMYDPADATHQAFLTDLVDGSIDAYTLTFTDSGAKTITGNAFAKSFNVTGANKDKVVGRLVLKFTGALTFPV